MSTSMLERFLVDSTPVQNSQHQNNQLLILNTADSTVIPNAVPPKTGK